MVGPCGTSCPRLETAETNPEPAKEGPATALSWHRRVGLFRQIVGERMAGVGRLVRPTSPFADLKRASSDVVWLEPRLVGEGYGLTEVSYSELMEDRLRDP